jgi:hypothetical protein
VLLNFDIEAYCPISLVFIIQHRESNAKAENRKGLASQSTENNIIVIPSYHCNVTLHKIATSKYASTA